MAWRSRLTALYPDAVEFPRMAARAFEVLTGLGFTRENTLFANSTCRDELMHASVVHFAEMWGENFDLAGLGGYPSAGITGFCACASHVPDGGNFLILYGSHVGISETGAFGVARRPGIGRDTRSCGAVLALLEKLVQDRHYAPAPDPLDAEQAALESELTPLADRILEAPDRIAAVTECAYEVIDNRLGQIAARSGHDGTVALLGGITVNTPSGEPDFFVPRRFEIRQNDRTVVLLGALSA